MELFIAGLAAKYPLIFTIASIMGIARMVIKPLIVAAHTYVLSTDDGGKDDAYLVKIEQNKIFKGVLFVLDYVFSLKLKAPVKVPASLK